ncbi:MAG: gamma-glutamylcyclotransferase family protein [Acetobacteraceae bacterium]
MRVFLYGTLMDPEVAKRVSGEDGFLRSARPALLPGWRRARLRGTPFPTLVRAADGAVHGLLAEVPPEVLRRLHAYEGPLYRFLPVRVLCDGASIAARAWIAPQARAVLDAAPPGVARSPRPASTAARTAPPRRAARP